MLAPFGTPARARRYTLCDLPEVEALAEQYIRAIRGSSATDLSLGKLNSNPNSTTSCASASGDYSLFISNYAFSELTSAVQQIYWDEVISCSRRGYVTMNAYNGMSTTDFVAKLRESGVRVGDLAVRVAAPLSDAVANPEPEPVEVSE